MEKDVCPNNSSETIESKEGIKDLPLSERDKHWELLKNEIKFSLNVANNKLRKFEDDTKDNIILEGTENAYKDILKLMERIENGDDLKFCHLEGLLYSYREDDKLYLKDEKTGEYSLYKKKFSV